MENITFKVIKKRSNYADEIRIPTTRQAETTYASSEAEAAAEIPAADADLKPPHHQQKQPSLLNLNSLACFLGF